jgi:uncharacterized protein (TIGR03067 family)
MLQALGADKAPDQTLIQGRWRLVTQIDAQGKELPLPKDAPDYSFEGDKLFSFSDGEKRELGKFRLDEKAKPKEMDWLFVDDKTGRVNEAATWKGVYTIDGDTLKFAIDPYGKRPQGFDAKQRTAVLNVLKRAK